MPLAARRRQRPAYLRLGGAEGSARRAASFATLFGKLKDLKHERPPEQARRIRFQRFDGRPHQNATRNRKSPRWSLRRPRAVVTARLLRRFGKEAYNEHPR
jgi:hypothetical protein